MLFLWAVLKSLVWNNGTFIFFGLYRHLKGNPIWEMSLLWNCWNTEDMLTVTRGPNYTLFFNQESWAKNSLSSLPVHQIWQKQRWVTKQTAWRCCYPLVLFLEASLWCCSSDCKMVSVAWQVKCSTPSQTTESAVFWENVILTLPQRHFIHRGD